MNHMNLSKCKCSASNYSFETDRRWRMETIAFPTCSYGNPERHSFLTKWSLSQLIWQKSKEQVMSLSTLIIIHVGGVQLIFKLRSYSNTDQLSYHLFFGRTKAWVWYLNTAWNNFISFLRISGCKQRDKALLIPICLTENVVAFWRDWEDLHVT